jgi:uncharacterized protein
MPSSDLTLVSYTPDLMARATAGDAKAQNNLGLCFAQGRGIERNETTAFSWFMLAAKKGYAMALNNVGICFSEGWGVRKNESRALLFYWKAGRKGLAQAQYNVGEYYSRNPRTTKDDNMFNLARRLGKIDSEVFLYYSKNPTDWFLAAAKQDLPEAQYAMFLFSDVYENRLDYYYLGWLIKAAKNGHQKAQQELQKRKTQRLLKKAAQNGYV